MTTRRTESLSGELSPGGPGAGFLLPGAVVGDGRYRLLAQFGVDDRAAAHLWRARDAQLRRDVALTVLIGEPGDADRAQDARRTLDRAAHAASLSHPGMARVLDVLSMGNGITAGEGLLGMVVADWSAGTDLVDLVAEHPLPAANAARLLEPLASAVERAHHSGLVLGADHPQRIRVTPEGTLRLAFPGPLPDAELRDDVKGLGAILYLLLTGKWPLAGGPQGLPMAPIAPDGSIMPPNTQLYVSSELSTVAIRSLEDTSVGGIRTSATLLTMLDAARAADPTGPVDERAEPDEDGPIWTTKPPVRDSSRRRKLAIGVTALAIATVGVLAWVGMMLIDLFSDSTDTTSPVSDDTSTSREQEGEPSEPPVKPIKPAGVAVFNVAGTADNAELASAVVDGDPATHWETDAYLEQFPSFKPGIGIMASFADASRFTSVTVDSPGGGTVVEIRTAPSELPTLEETKVLGSVTLEPGQTEITLDESEPTQHVLVWITTLGEGNISSLGELQFTRQG